MKRNIVRINEEKCIGCGACISICPQSIIEMVDGKARITNELLCDGLGGCIRRCPEGAMSMHEIDTENPLK